MEEDFAQMQPVRARVRFDYRGVAVPGRLFIGHKGAAEASAALRDRATANLKYEVEQGIRVEDVDSGHETYVLIDPATDQEVAYSPVYVVVQADSIEDLADFTLRDEFRTIEILDPPELTLSPQEIGRLLARANQRLRTMAQLMVRRSERY